MGKPTTEIDKIVRTKIQTSHKRNILVKGGKGMTTVQIGKAVNENGDLIRPTEFVFHTSEIDSLIAALTEYKSAIDAIENQIIQ
jgi:hypothetical protein